MTKNLHVCVVTNFVPPYYLAVLERLAEQVGDLSVLVSTLMEPNRPWEVFTGRLKVLKQKALMFRHRRKHKMGFSDEVYFHIPYDTLPTLWRLRPDVVVSAQLGIRSLQAVVYRQLFPTCRLILWTYLSEHTEAGVGRAKTALRRLLLKFADAVLVNGASGARYLRCLGLPMEKLARLPYTIDMAPFFSLSTARGHAESRRLIYFGQLVERKGLLPFLNALSQWLYNHPAERCEMWIVGDGPLRRDIESAQWPAALSLKCFGNVPYDALGPLYGQAGVLVFPTLSDEWGVVVNEALAAGLPVLGSRYSQAVEELIADGINGWTFRTDHPEEISNALDRMMSASPGKLDEMRSAGRQTITSITPEYGAKCFLQAIEHAKALRGQPRNGTEKRVGDEVGRIKVEDSF
jgi:glycosyltransferase involved in cell wall biosynthesis